MVSIIGPNRRIFRGSVQGVGTCARPALLLTRTVRVGIVAELVVVECRYQHRFDVGISIGLM